MSNQDVIDFLNRVVSDPGLRREVESAVRDEQPTGEAIAAVAGRHGLHFDVVELAEVMRAINASASRELSDEELDAVAGGFGTQLQSAAFMKLGTQLKNHKTLGSGILDPTNFGALKF